MDYNVWESCMLFPGFSRSACASWVQAWGSIGAILWAAYAGRSDDRHQRRNALSEARTFAGLVAGCIEEIAEVMKGMSEGGVAARRAALQAALDGERRIHRALLPLDSIAAVAALQSLGAQTVEVATTVEEHGGTLPPPMIDRIRRDLNYYAVQAAVHCRTLGSRHTFERLV